MASSCPPYAPTYDLVCMLYRHTVSIWLWKQVLTFGVTIVVLFIAMILLIRYKFYCILGSTNEELQATLQELDDLREQLSECQIEVQQLQEEKQVGSLGNIIVRLFINICRFYKSDHLLKLEV